jgi:hypothetical protein
MSYTPGPGDAETWPPFSGHPHDPRTPEDDSDDTTAELIAEVRCFIVAAELAAMNGDMDKAREALIEAKLSIENLIGEEA